MVLLLSVVVTRRAWARDAAQAHAELGDLRARVEELEHEHGTPSTTTSAAEFVITGLGDETASEPGPDARVDGAVFADIVLRETVVKAASLAHGLRRGLAPATRNRIRFEMKQEVRRARKQRRADLKAAQRDLHARQRRAMAEDLS
jgi:hypothetical protein